MAFLPSSPVAWLPVCDVFFNTEDQRICIHPGSGPVKHIATAVLGFTTDNPDAPNTGEDEATQGVSGESDKRMFLSHCDGVRARANIHRITIMQ